MDDDLEHYRNHPLVLALASNRYLLTKRRVPPVPRDGKGRIMPGFSGNPFGRPPGRQSMRAAFHRHGLEHLAKLSELADDPRLTPGERAVVHAEFVRLTYSLRAIRSDASAQRKLEQQERERLMDQAVMDLCRRVQIPPGARLPAPRAAELKPEPRERPPAAPSLPAPRNEARPPPAAEPKPEPGETPAAAPPAPEVPGGAAQAPPDGDGQTQPREAPQQPFRISLPF
jgi:hypothetical protein